MTTRKATSAKDQPAPATVEDAETGAAVAAVEQMAENQAESPWAALAAPFPAGQTEWLPKVLHRQDQDKGRCETGSPYCADGHPCGGWHARAIHLTYVGHAGVTMRLNSVDPTWTWEPMATTEYGTPMFANDGLWIRLTVLGVTRLGFGDAQGKSGPNAVKEAIGDAIRNAAMRFGVGTYLWSKSEEAQVLAAGGDPTPEPEVKDQPRQERQEPRQGRQQRSRAQETAPAAQPAQETAQAAPEGITNAEAEALAVRLRALPEEGAAKVRALYQQNRGPKNLAELTREQFATVEGWVEAAEIEAAQAAVADAVAGEDPWTLDKPPF